MGSTTVKKNGAAAAGTGGAPECVHRLLNAGKSHTCAPPCTLVGHWPRSLKTLLLAVVSCSAVFIVLQEKYKAQISLGSAWRRFRDRLRRSSNCFDFGSAHTKSLSMSQTYTKVSLFFRDFVSARM